MPIFGVSIRVLKALVLLSLSAMASAIEVGTDYNVLRLSPKEFPALPAQVVSVLIEMRCTIPQASFFLKAKSNVISGSFAKRGQNDYAVLCSRNGVSHIQVVWGGQARCESELHIKNDSIFFQQETSGKMEYSRILGVTSRRAIANFTHADDDFKPSAPYHEAIQDAFADKASSVLYCEKGKWQWLGGAD